MHYLNHYFGFLNQIQLKIIKLHALFKLLIQLLLNKVELKILQFFFTYINYLHKL